MSNLTFVVFSSRIFETFVKSDFRCGILGSPDAISRPVRSKLILFSMSRCLKQIRLPFGSVNGNQPLPEQHRTKAAFGPCTIASAIMTCGI